ncbi:hypothetical protein ZWY2020_033316 [Hordeum vulgare]|nr:hypothetical protein ZWY2020_033316 [Hordeum vulgare]
MKKRRDQGPRKWRSVDPYAVRKRTVADPQFHTKEQQDFYETVLLDKSSAVSDMRYVDWEYIKANKHYFPHVTENFKLVDIEDFVGREMTAWNDEIIMQFYYTAHFYYDGRIVWMTEGHRYESTIDEWATIIGAQKAQEGDLDVYSEPKMNHNSMANMYKPVPHKVMDLVVETVRRTAADHKRSCGFAPYIQMLMNAKIGKHAYLLDRPHLPLHPEFEDNETVMDSSHPSSATAREGAEAPEAKAARNAPTPTPELRTGDEKMSFLLHGEVDSVHISRSSSDDEESPLPTTTQFTTQTRSAVVLVSEARPSSSAQASTPSAPAPTPHVPTPPPPGTSVEAFVDALMSTPSSATGGDRALRDD